MSCSAPVRRRRAAVVLATAALLAAACRASTSTSPSSPSTSASVPAPAPPSVPTPSSSSSSVSVSASSSSSSPTSASGSASAPPSTPRSSPSSGASGTAQLPLGGTAIIGHYRVVAFYGAAGGGALGVLGSKPPEQIVSDIRRRAQAFAPYGLPVQPAMELIATVARASAGADGDYSAPIPMSTIRHYLAVAHANKMLLVLDLQPGRASFLSQAKRLHDVLTDPSVSLALDPEWKVGPGQKPGGGRIGSSSAAGVNDVSQYLSTLISANHLPDKLLVVHEFTESMLPDRQDIVRRAGVEVSFHADGFGSPRVKKGVFGRLDFPGHPFGVGFKLFLTQDTRLMSPAEVMRLRPRPDIVTYQ